MEDNTITGWIPYKLEHTEGQLRCHWLNTLDKPFIEPFFDETILKCRTANQRGYTFPSVSSLEMMKEWANGLIEVAPSAIIFHISRCGSTLVSQLLSTSADNVVLAEVPFLDDILQLPFKEPDFTEAEINELFTASLKYHSYKITSGERADDKNATQLFVKTDSWHIFFYRQLRLLYPAVPFILIYRSPDEVFRSHRKLAGMQAVPGMIEPKLFGFKHDVAEENAEVYLANVLAGYLSKYIEIAEADSRCILLNYNEGPMQMIKKIAAFINTGISPQELLKMNDRSQYHSKKPGERFSEDAVTGFPSCLDMAMELYQTLEEKRLAVQ